MKKITSILMVVIGLVVIVLGASFQPEATSYDLTEKTFKYAAENYNLQYCAFGGDFYTEIYAASDMIVDVLDDINRSTETVVAVQNAIHNASASSVHALEELNRNIGKTVRFVLIAIGLSIVAAALPQLGSAFAPEGRALKTAAPAVEVKNGAEDASAAEIARPQGKRTRRTVCARRKTACRAECPKRGLLLWAICAMVVAECRKEGMGHAQRLPYPYGTGRRILEGRHCTSPRGRAGGLGAPDAVCVQTAGNHLSP